MDVYWYPGAETVEAIGVIREAETMTNIPQAGTTGTMTTTIERKIPGRVPHMRYILFILAVIPFLSATGCIFAGGRDHSNDRNHPGNGGNDERPSSVNHAEYPGDMDHSEHQ